MTMPEHNQELSERDRLPPNERGQDEQRTELTHGLAVEDSRPLTADERRAADNDTPLPERVYAPASERVPKEPVAGHRDFVEHTDQSTPERQAVAQPSEPSFTRVERPSTQSQQAWSPPPYSSGYDYEAQSSGGMGLPIGVSAIVTIAGGALGAWLFMRWRRERNKPVNRWRRQAFQTAADVRSRVPSPDEMQSRGLGMAASLLSIGLVLWQKGRQQSQQQVHAVADADWQHRLIALKKRWSPRRLEMEKFSISRHH